MNRGWILWILAFLITLSSVVYQRLTGPTYPIRGSIVVNNEEIGFRLLRTHETTSDAIMTIKVNDKNIRGGTVWKRYKSHDSLLTQPLIRKDSNLIITIPRQPMAGKIQYRVFLIDSAGTEHNLTDEPVIIRFKGPVPGFVLFPHVIFMFLAMLLATRTGLEAIAKRKNTYRMTIATSILILIGGLILGPAVQKYAFDAFWTGWPLGHDLTDNKMAVAMLFWIIALIKGRHAKKGRKWIIIASAVTLLIFLIPHSLLGSEIDYTKMN